MGKSALALRQVVLLGLFLLWRAVAAEPSPLVLAESWREGLDVTRYLASEKYDGVRGYWDGQRLWTRAGHPIAAPSWFVAALPAEKLDGELWLGRGRFEQTVAALRREPPLDAEWRQMRYQVFELPETPGSFAERAERIRVIVAQADVPWLHAVEQFRLADDKALARRLREVVNAGGEGLMLHRADAPYVTGRSDALLKAKLWHDAEAVVIAHRPGKGRYGGMLGALRVRSPEGREFSLGTGFSEAQRRSPPPLGATVTYRYRGLTATGLPRFASFWRVRAAE